MPNLYGVANAPCIAGSYVLGTNPSVPAATWTTFLSSPTLIAPSQGFFYPVAIGTALISFGGTLPGALQFGLAVGAGAAQTNYGFNPAGWVASTTFRLVWQMVGAPADIPWRAPGTAINLQALTAGQAITVNAGETAFAIFLLRAPDQ